jgi:uncharacterized surface protein with fasciclin (FAS1) repeats
MKTLKLTLASAIALSLAACNGAASDEAAPTDEASAAEEAIAGTIVEVAQGDPTFSTLVKAVTAAKLAETLSGDGPFTVFAPTDEAFAKVDAATLETLTTTDTETLGDILKYHVVAADVNAAGLTAAIKQATDEGKDYEIETVNGGKLIAKIVDGGVVLTDAKGGTAKVTATDVKASNGTIHVIDTVLMP